MAPQRQPPVIRASVIARVLDARVASINRLLALGGGCSPLARSDRFVFGSDFAQSAYIQHRESAILASEDVVSHQPLELEIHALARGANDISEFLLRDTC